MRCDDGEQPRDVSRPLDPREKEAQVLKPGGKKSMKPVLQP